MNRNPLGFVVCWALCAPLADRVTWYSGESTSVGTPTSPLTRPPRAHAAARSGMVARAVKRARYMGLLPYTSATL